MTPELVPLAEVGRRLGGVSTKTVRRMVDRGDLQAYRIGGHVMVDASSVEDYVEAQRIVPGAASSPVRPRASRAPSRGGLLELLDAEAAPLSVKPLDRSTAQE